MTRLLILMFALLSIKGYSQTGDAGSGWAKLLWDKAEKVKDNVRANKQAFHEASLLKQTIMLVDAAKKTRDLTGQAVASAKQLKDLQDKMNNDTRSISQLTGDQLSELTEFLDWNNALKGKGYQPIFNLSEAYEANTASLRGRDGTMNVAGAMLNSLSDQHKITTDKAFSQHNLQIRRTTIMVHDFQIREHLRLAKYHENQARIKTLQLNLHVFGQAFSKVGQTVKKDFKMDALKSETDIQTLQTSINNDLRSAQIHRSEANRIMSEALALNKPSVSAVNEVINYQRLLESNISILSFQRMQRSWGNLEYQDQEYIEEEPLIFDWN